MRDEGLSKRSPPTHCTIGYTSRYMERYTTGSFSGVLRSLLAAPDSSNRYESCCLIVVKKTNGRAVALLKATAAIICGSQTGEREC